MYILISLIGGLGLFLYGISVMGEGLQKSTGPKLEKAIGLLTSNVVMGVLVGTVVNFLYQSDFFIWWIIILSATPKIDKK